MHCIGTLLLLLAAIVVVRSEDCSGHGIVHGNHCHCAKGYKSKGLECVPMNGGADASCPVGGIHWELSALVSVEKGAYTVEFVGNDDDMATMLLPLQNVSVATMETLETSRARSLQLLEDMTLARKLVKANQVMAPTDKLLYVIRRNNADELEKAKAACENVPGNTWHIDHCDGPDGHSGRRLADAKMTVNLTVAEPGVVGLHMQHNAMAEFGMRLLNNKNEPVEITVFKAEAEGEADDQPARGPRNASVAVWWKTMLAVFIVAILSVIGILLLAIRHDLPQRQMDALMALSSGALFGAAFIHILPEAIEFYNLYGQMDLALCMIFSAGFVGAMVLEMLLEVSLSKIGGGHRHHNQANRPSAVKLLSPSTMERDGAIASPDVETPVINADASVPPSTFSLKVQWATIRPMAYIILVGDLFHNFVDGVLIATAFLACDDGLGIAVTASAILHEVPQEVADFIILVDAGFTTFQALFFNFVSALSAFLGAFVILAAVQVTKETMGALLGFGAGTLVYIAATDLLPRVLQVQTFTAFFARIILFCTGIGLLALTTLYHIHCEGDV